MEFWTTVGELVENPSPYPDEFLRVGDHLIVFASWRGRSGRQVRRSAFRILHAFRLSDETAPLMDTKMVSIEVFVDTAAFLEAIGHAANG